MQHTDEGYVGAKPRPHGLLSVQNGGLEKTLANRRSCVSKHIGDFDCFKMVAGFEIW